MCRLAVHGRWRRSWPIGPPRDPFEDQGIGTDLVDPWDGKPVAPHALHDPRLALRDAAEPEHGPVTKIRDPRCSALLE
jgi:hypothetical protein